MLYNSAIEAICTAPIMRMKELFPNHDVWLKGDFVQKSKTLNNRADRVALYIMDNAIQKGLLDNKSVVITPIDTLTKISLAKIAALKGFAVIAVSPQNITQPYIKKLNELGADIVYTPASRGVRGAQKEAQYIAKMSSDIWLPQYHKQTVFIEALANEILLDFPEGLDYIIVPSKLPARINYFSFFIKKFLPDVKVYISTSSRLLPNLPHTEDGHHLIKKPRSFHYIDGAIVGSKERSLHIASIIPKKEGLPGNKTSGLSFNTIEKLIRFYSISTDAKILGFQGPL